MESPELMSALTRAKDQQELFTLTLNAARNAGIALERSDLEAVVNHNRRERLMRSLP